MTATQRSNYDHYTRASEQAADQIIRSYSTSFGAATRLLGPRHRTHVRNVYALVRVADELVDGVAAEAHLTLAEQHRQLDALEHETVAALDRGYSSNPIVHAFAHTARLADIGPALLTPFFASMRMDLQPPNTTAEGGDTDPVVYDADAHADYVHGSAEVVGLMCLQIFVRDTPPDTHTKTQLIHGAKQLGAAFQNVNFLRDLQDDTQRLARNYLGDVEQFSDADKSRWVATIRTQLSDARAVIPMLPADARAAVDTARRLFGALADNLDRRTVAELCAQRVRVSNPRKAVLITRALINARRNPTR